jgi:uncharacterized BrkB/YihY/UPF0761 family membrane protein
MAEPEEGIWGSEPGDLGRRLSSPKASLTLPDRAGSEWGLASLLTALACLVLCPGTLLVWASVITAHEHRWDRPSVHRLCIVLICCEFLVLGLIGTALAFAIVGGAVARKNQTSCALPVTALIVSSVTLALWIVILVCSFSMTDGLW